MFIWNNPRGFDLGKFHGASKNNGVIDADKNNLKSQEKKNTVGRSGGFGFPLWL